ncbi:hypothetical protein IU405_11085 [Polaribacter sp. BAL334]|uniref:hypothetical protein n=1 Tax=Polaribacter sp. BAL334 TaxID=1708178 RepID=UPI0018D268DA|nr:hypothetical protein [Polaribacter sp. BAL334]MBG7612790.1 hypothetical protein [Polaribacter sp. BAL334]
MKEKIKSFIITHKIINILFVIGLRLIHRKSKKEINIRSNISIFDYKKIISEIPQYPTDIVIDNNYYGLSVSLKKYLANDKPLNAYIEHGLFLGSIVKKDSIDWCVSKIITLSEIRKNHIKKKTTKNVIKIGPYIHYVDDFLKEDTFCHHKNDIGKTLLVFPSHSIKNLATDFNNDELITFLKSVQNEFDTVIICLYWRDALNQNLVKTYENCGFKITSAGHINDIFFLSRLKSIIKLADFVVSNSVGTHIGYVNYLKKPQMILRQKVNYKVSKNDHRAFSQRNQSDLNTLESETKEIENSFKKYTFNISSKQNEVIEKYWGISEIKTKEALSNALSNS